MGILVINGPNLNFLGIREPDIYGTMTHDELCCKVIRYGQNHNISIFVEQTNYEGKIIDLLQTIHMADEISGIILNAGALTHYSYAIYDAIKSIDKPVIEVHLTDPSTREDFRHLSVIEPACIKTFKGEGIVSYLKAIDYFISIGIK